MAEDPEYGSESASHVDWQCGHDTRQTVALLNLLAGSTKVRARRHAAVGGVPMASTRAYLIIDPA